MPASLVRRMAVWVVCNSHRVVPVVVVVLAVPVAEALVGLVECPLVC